MYKKQKKNDEARTVLSSYFQSLMDHITIFLFPLSHLTKKKKKKKHSDVTLTPHVFKIRQTQFISIHRFTLFYPFLTWIFVKSSTKKKKMQEIYKFQVDSLKHTNVY